MMLKSKILLLAWTLGQCHAKLRPVASDTAVLFVPKGPSFTVEDTTKESAPLSTKFHPNNFQIHGFNDENDDHADDRDLEDGFTWHKEHFGKSSLSEDEQENGNRFLGTLAENAFPVASVASRMLVNIHPFSAPKVKSASSVTAAVNDCDAETESAKQCMSTSCADCISNFVEGLPDSMICLDYRIETCDAIETCGCGACQYQLETAFNCYVEDDGCDPLDCENLICGSELSTAAHCVGTTMDSCSDCIDDAFQTLLDEVEGQQTILCSTLSNAMCPAIWTYCDCGMCRQDIDDVSDTASGCSILFIFLTILIEYFAVL